MSEIDKGDLEWLGQFFPRLRPVLKPVIKTATVGHVVTGVSGLGVWFAHLGAWLMQVRFPYEIWLAEFVPASALHVGAQSMSARSECFFLFVALASVLAGLGGLWLILRGWWKRPRTVRAVPPSMEDRQS